MGPISSMADLLAMLRRRAISIATIATLGIVATVFYVMSLPATYEASTAIQVRTPTIPGTQAIPAARRVQAIEQQLMRRGAVLDIVERFELYRDAPSLTPDERVERFRNDTDFQQVTSGGTGAGEGQDNLTGLIIRARAASAELSASIANFLASELILGDRREREQSSTVALDFLRAEQDRLSTSLATIDAQIGTIKRDNEESLPAADEPLRTEQVELRTQQLDLERQLLALEREQLTLRLRAESGPEGAVDSVATRLGNLTAELAQARRLLPAGHPEITRLEAELSNLRGSDGDVPLSASEREAALIDTQRAAIVAQADGIRARQAEIDAAFAKRSDVERQLTSLEREQARLVAQLATTTARLSDVETQRVLDEGRTGETMVVLEAASPPDYAMSSSRKKVAVLGGAASLALAFAVALLREARQPQLRTAAQLTRALGVAPVVAIPSLLGARTLRRRRRMSLAVAAAIVAAGVAASAAIVAASRSVMPGETLADAVVALFTGPKAPPPGR